MSHNVHYITVTDAVVNQRIDNFLRTKYKGLPKSRLYKALRKGEIRVNKKRVGADYRLQLDDRIRIPPLRVSEPPEVPVIDRKMRNSLKKAVLMEHPDFYIVDKPAGLAVHRGSQVAVGLIDAMQQLMGDSAYLQLAHRLDKHTSGCVLIARNREFLLHFHDLLKANRVNKYYYALVSGHWPQTIRTIDLPLRRTIRGDETKVEVIAVEKGGKSAVTHVKPICFGQDLTLLDVRIETGRMHQIRVHLAHYGHPILNDIKYGNKMAGRIPGFKRLGLHAAQMAFQLKNGQKINCKSRYPAEFEVLLDV